MVKASKAIACRIGLMLPPLATFAGYYVAAMTSLYFARGQDGIAMLWPASGILLASLLITSRRQAGWHIAAAATASFCANIDANNTLSISIGFTLANIIESIFASLIIRTKPNYRVSFTDSDGLTFFYVAVIIATILSATIATAIAPKPSIQFWFSWFSTDLLGALIVTPVILIVARSLFSNRFGVGIKAIPETVAVLATVAVVTVLTFGQSSYPALFMPMLAVLFAVFRMGPLGAAGGVLIVATISSIAFNSGSGPQALMQENPLQQSLWLQFYLLMLFTATLPVATLLAARKKLADRLATKVRLLQLAENAASVGHWRLDTADHTVTWSDEVYRIHGIMSDVPPRFEDAIQAYHPDDRDRVSAHIESAIERGSGFEFTARLVRPDGEIRHVFSKGEVDDTGNQDSFGLFGIIQDITTQIVHEKTIEAARAQAEIAALEAIKLAETDQLTGIANRRRTAFVLDKAIDVSNKAGRPLSIVIFDIDHFKRVNDTYGHVAGDEVLKRVAFIAAAQLRNGDTIGRFGGEEFVIVLPNATSKNAILITERVRESIEGACSNPQVTISAGVAQLTPGELPEALIHRADQALYAAKAKGRNTMHLAA